VCTAFGSLIGLFGFEPSGTPGIPGGQYISLGGGPANNPDVYVTNPSVPLGSIETWSTVSQFAYFIFGDFFTDPNFAFTGSMFEGAVAGKKTKLKNPMGIATVFAGSAEMLAVVNVNGNSLLVFPADIFGNIKPFARVFSKKGSMHQPFGVAPLSP
jgi:hypothetical protein